MSKKLLAALILTLVAGIPAPATAQAPEQIALAPSSIATPPDSDATAYLQGVVRNAKTGDPIGNACVTVTSGTLHRVAETCTESDGRYQLKLPAIVSFRFEVRAEGYRPKWLPNGMDVLSSGFSLKADETRLIDVALGGDVGTLAGRVTRQDGDVAPHSFVYLYPADSSSRTGLLPSDVNGDYSHQEIPAGNYHVAFSVSGYPLQWHPSTLDRSLAQPVTIAPGQPLTLDQQMIALAVKPVPRGVAAVSGQVTSEGAPVPNATVTLLDQWGGKRQLAADAEGRYSLANLVTGSYAIGASGPGLATTWYLNRAIPVFASLGADANVRDLLIPARTGVVKGTITDYNGTLLPPNSNVTLFPQAGGISGTGLGALPVRLDGSFEFRGVPEGTYWLRLSSSRRTYYHGGSQAYETSIPVTVGNGQTVELTDTLPAPAYAQIVVRDSVTGDPVSGVCVQRNSGRSCTQADGTVWEGPNWTNTPIEMAASAQENPYYFGSVYTRFTLQPGQTIEVPLTVRAGATLEIPTTQANGSRFTGHLCAHGQELGLGRSWRFDRCGSPDVNGVVTLGPIEPATVGILLIPSMLGAQWLGENGGAGQVEEAVPVELRAGMTTTAPKARFDPGVSLTGVIKKATTSGSLPLQGACVMIAPGPNSLFGCSDADGGFVIPSVGPYKWPVRANAAGFAQTWNGDVSSRSQSKLVGPGGSPIEITLRPEGKMWVNVDGCCEEYSVLELIDAYNGDLVSTSYGNQSFRYYELNSGRVIMRIKTPTQTCWLKVYKQPFKFGLQYFPTPVGKETSISGAKCSLQEPLLLRPTSGPAPRTRTPVEATTTAQTATVQKGTPTVTVTTESVGGAAAQAAGWGILASLAMY